MTIGIDYGVGRTNRDPANGIRYGVISQHDIAQAWSDESEADYGEPTCPKCGNAIASSDNLPEESEEWEHYGHGCADFACERCEHFLDSSDVYGAEPHGFNYDGDGYQLTSCLDSDVMVLKSPFYTFAPFCSPCVPGAGNLNGAADDASQDGAQTYCLGHDWFESGKAPYTVYSVDTGAIVEASAS